MMKEEGSAVWSRTRAPVVEERRHPGTRGIKWSALAPDEDSLAEEHWFLRPNSRSSSRWTDRAGLTQGLEYSASDDTPGNSGTDGLVDLERVCC